MTILLTGLVVPLLPICRHLQQGDDLCCGRRTDSVSTVGGTPNISTIGVAAGFVLDDDPGCGTGIKIQ